MITEKQFLEARESPVLNSLNGTTVMAYKNKKKNRAHISELRRKEHPYRYKSKSSGTNRAQNENQLLMLGMLSGIISRTI